MSTFHLCQSRKNWLQEIISCWTLMYTILSCFVLVVGGTGGSSWKMRTAFPSGENHYTWQWQWTPPVCSISTDSVQAKQYPFKIQVWMNDHPLKHPRLYFVFFSIVEKISPGVSPTIIVLSPPLISLTGTYGWHREGYKTEGHLKVDPPWQQKHLRLLMKKQNLRQTWLAVSCLKKNNLVVAPKYLDLNGLNSKKHLHTHTHIMALIKLNGWVAWIGHM